MQQLNFPVYQFKITHEQGKQKIFDELRGRMVKLTPEEWVRQNLIKYLVQEKHYPAGLISVEHTIKLNNMAKRCDIVVYNRKGLPVLIAECKASDIILNQKVFDQIMIYNIRLNVPYLIITNGLKHYCSKIDSSQKKYTFLSEIPEFQTFE